MKKFTVKDFITYNNPCFSCNSQINFKIGFINLDGNPSNISFLRPIVTGEFTEIDLEIKYNDSLKLVIAHKTNKIQTNNIIALTKYLSRHKLFLCSTCDRCHTKIESHYLTFHPRQGYVEAVGLSSEELFVFDNGNIYRIRTSFMEEKSSMSVCKKSGLDKRNPTTLHIELPLLPLYKLKNKETFLNKMKLYTLFS